MVWEVEAVEKLSQYGACKTAVEIIPAEIRRLELEYGAIRSSAADRIPGGKSDRGTREDKLLSNIVRREELARQLEITKEWCAIVERGLETLNERDKLVLDRFYLHPQKGAAGRLCEELLLMEESSVFRIRRKALRRFTQAVYGIQPQTSIKTC